jgi:hypothetical protein
VVVGVIDPEDVERAGLALIDEPAEISEVMDEPEARDRQGDGLTIARGTGAGVTIFLGPPTRTMAGGAIG